MHLHSFLATNVVKVKVFMFFCYVTFYVFSENKIIGVCVDIAERRFTIRAAETDANEGFFSWGFILWFHIVFIFHLNFFFWCLSS